MVEDTAREEGSSSRPAEARSSDRHHHRHRGSRHRNDSDDEARKHGKRSSHSNKERDDSDRHRSKDDERHRHRDDRHRSRHHPSSSNSHNRHREREGEEERSERKRRHRDEDSGDRRRHESKAKHSRHHSERHGPRHGSRSDKDCQDDSHSHGKQPATDFIPTSESLSLTSQAATDQVSGDATSGPISTLKRDDWMTGGFGDGTSTRSEAPSDEASYFSSLGKARVKPPRPEKPDPEKLKISSRELNTQLREGKTVDEYEAPSSAAAAPQFGAPGYQWRMMKLKRTLEAAEQEGRRLEEVALERYASWEDFEQAQAERRFLDGKEGKKEKGGEAGRSTPTLQSVARRSYLLASGGGGGGEQSTSGTDSPGGSRPASRQAFRRPGESSQPSTPTPSQSRPPRNVGFETPSSKPATPTAIPSVFTPVLPRPTDSQPQQGVVLDDGSSDPDRPILTPDQLNKLQAKVMQAELMGGSNLDALRSEYNSEKARAQAHKGAGDRGGAFAASSSSADPTAISANTANILQAGDRQLQVLPTLDARGRMYDIGSLTSSAASTSEAASKRKRKGRDPFEARDPTTGEIVRYSADDDTLSLSDLVRQERFSAGPSSVKNLDATLASNIMTDHHFSSDMDEQDSSAHRYAAHRAGTSDALKRQFAINDFARTAKALERCRFCFRDEGRRPPRVTLVSSGYRAYLAIPDREAVGPAQQDHVHIVPMQHHLSLLEADDDTWDEMTNFQKCLVQLASSHDKTVVFYETLLSIKAQQHAVMEAVLVPAQAMDRLPGVFKQSLSQVGGEWSTHGKAREFTPSRPFRRSLVPQLPYFAVTWDHRWSTGYGHVIENLDADQGGGGAGRSAYDVDEMAAGGGTGGAHGRFDPHFARDVIRGVLEDLDAETEAGEGEGAYVRSFGKDKVRSDADKARIKQRFVQAWNRFDWTKMLTHNDGGGGGGGA